MDIITRKQAKDKNLTQYFSGKPCPNGHIALRWVSTLGCSKCASTKLKRWRADNIEHRRIYGKKWNAEHPESIYKTRQKLQPRFSARAKVKRRANVLPFLVYQAKARAKRIGVPFDITPNDINMPTHCPIFGVKFQIGKKRQIDASATLDRIIPSLGYVKGNVQVICAKANRVKNDASLEELQKVVKFLSLLVECNNC